MINKKIFVLLVLCLWGAHFTYSQVTFSKRYTFGYASANFMGIEVTDSCIYATGLVSDTLPPFYPTGIIWAKLSHEGELLDYKPQFRDSVSLTNWYGGLESYRDGFISSGRIERDTSASVMLVRFSSEGEISSSSEFSYFFPSQGEKFIHNMRLVSGIDDKVLLPTREYNPEGAGLNQETILQLFDSTGTMLWRKNFGGVHGSKLDFPWHTAALGNGFVISSYTSNSDLVNHDFELRNYIFAVDTTGELLWDYLSPEDLQLGHPTSIYAEEADSSVIVATFLGEEIYANPDRNTVLWGPAYIYKLWPAGEVEWTQTLHEPYRAPFNSVIYEIIKAKDGSGYLLGGYVAQYSEEEGADERGWLVKISPEGDSLWSRQYRYLPPNDVTDQHQLHDLEEMPDGGFLMAGMTVYYQEAPPIQRAWLLRVDEHGCLVPGCELVSTEEPEVAPALALRLYPNPATDHINILLKDPQLPRRRGAELRLLDLQGRTLRQHPAGEIDEVMNIMPLQGLPAGAYLLQYRADGQVLAVERLVVR